MQILRTLARAHVTPERLNEMIAFYERITQENCALRFRIADLDIEVAMVASFQIVAGSNAALAPFQGVTVAFFVDSVVAFEDMLASAGAEILSASRQGPHGKYMIVRHPDGLVAEYADAAVSETTVM